MTAPVDRNTSLDVALTHLAVEPVIWVRAAAVRDEAGRWQARLIELTSGTEPPSWEQKQWRYPDGLFVADRLAGTAVVTALQARTLAIGRQDIGLPELSNVVTWDRRQSRSPSAHETLDWPVTETRLSMTVNTAEPQGPLVSDGDAPSFVTFYVAGACFFGLDRQPAGGQLHQGMMYRHQDLRARIISVRIADDSVVVAVEGQSLDGLLLELAGDTPGPRERLWQRHGIDPEPVRFPLDEGLPSGAWVLVRQGTEWLDRRFLSVPYSRGAEAGVEIVVDAGTRLEALVSSRERQQVEFKQQLPKDEDSKLKVMKTVCAFANGAGGSLLVGVDDDRNLLGVDERSVDRLRDQLTQMVGSWVEPRPSVSFEVLPVADIDKVVLEMWVDSGTALYGCGKLGEVRTPYVRHAGITERATVHEISAIVQARTTGRYNTVLPWQ